MQYSKHLSVQICNEAIQRRHEAQLLCWAAFRSVIHSVPLNSSIVDELDDICARKDVPSLLKACSSLESLYSSYDSLPAVAGGAAVTAFLKKYPFKGDFGIDPMEKTMERFCRAERLCALTNKRLRYYRQYGYGRIKRLPYANRILLAMREKISYWLGSLNLSEIYKACGHGPGVSIGSLDSTRTTRYYKYASDVMNVSPGCAHYAVSAINSNYQWLRALNGLLPFEDGPIKPLDIHDARIEFTGYNKVTFVPKTIDTKRAIAVEPMLNIYLQKGLGAVIRNRLRRNGLNLDSCFHKNRELARKGSLDETILTMDLSMASDTLSIELVREVLPPEWFDVLNSCRSVSGKLENGDTFRWQKFSSMGNGFTFELETMILYALVLSIGDFLHDSACVDEISVFGDDIVCPTDYAPYLSKMLRFLGFVVNEQKTFITGPFRESCGADWFKGEQVRPFYLKRELKADRDIIFVINSLRQKASLGYFNGYHNVCDLLSRRLSPSVRRHLVGPISDQVSDGYLQVEHDSAMASFLVTFDKVSRLWRYPCIIDAPQKFGGSARYRYVQFIDISEYRTDGASSGSRGDVTRRGRVTTKLQLSTALAWPTRNR